VPNRDFIGTDGPVGATVDDAQTRPSPPCPTTPAASGGGRRRADHHAPAVHRPPDRRGHGRGPAARDRETARVPGLL